MILTAILFFLFCLTIFEYMKSIISLQKSKLPSLPLYPIIGHTPHFFGNTDVLVNKILKLSEKFVGSLGLFVGTYFVAIFYNPEDITFLVNDASLQTKSMQYDFLKPALGNGILTSSGAHYRQSKRILVEAVSSSNMREYMHSFNKQSRLLVESLVPKIGREEFKLDETISFLIFINLLETIMGLEAHVMTDAEIYKYNRNIGKLTRCVFQRFYTIWLYPDFLFKMSRLYRKQNKIIQYLHSVTDKLILERKKIIESNNGRFEPNNNNKNIIVFIDKFFSSKKDNGEDFAIEDIRGDVLSLLGAGLETTVVSIGFVIMMLAIHQDAQQKAYEEIMQKLGEQNEDFSVNDLQQLTYMDQVLNETWRLYSPLPALGRNATHDVALPNGRFIPKGTAICISMGLLHRNPTLYSNPLKFNPDNFSPEKVCELHANSFIPFGVGSRKCLGGVYAKLSIKVMLTHLLRSYVFHTTLREDDFRLAMEITLKNKTGTLVSVENRKTMEK